MEFTCEVDHKVPSLEEDTRYSIPTHYICVLHLDFPCLLSTYFSLSIISIMLQQQGIKKRRPWNLTYVCVHATFLANVEPSTRTGSSIPSWMVEGLCCHCCYIWFPILTPDTAVMCDRSVRAENGTSVFVLLSNVVIVSVVF